ncbi:MAG: 50S ribosomal protein L32 [Spirochaetota bacterium]|nr:MAG: 50S ribosomal protein L32 [Spirochaetota bacterium]
MAVPKRRKSKSKTRMRRSHNMRVSPPGVVECPQCGEYTLPHRVCPNCGYYKDREVISPEEE